MLCCGCGPQTAAEKLVGHWHGIDSTGRVSAVADWQFSSDGTETASLSLPQGTLTAQGTWALHAGMLTQRTTSRAIVLGGQQKRMHLVNPLEAIYQCVLASETLTLTRPETHEIITLTRDTK